MAGQKEKMMVQQGLTLVAPVLQGKQDTLEAMLQAHMAPSFEAFAQLNTLHYARWVLLPPEGKRNAKPLLTLALNFDGGTHEFLTTLAAHWGKVLHPVFAHCAGCPPATAPLAQSVGYLKGLMADTPAHYVGAVGRNVQQIKQEAQLRDAMKQYLTTHRFEGQTACQVHKALQKHLLAQPQYAWAKKTCKLPYVSPTLVIGFNLLFLPVWPLLALWAIALYLVKELRDTPLGIGPNQVSQPHLQALKHNEDLTASNPFSLYLNLKPGPMRRATLRFSLWGVKMIHRLLLRNGILLGISTIHFAQWSLVNKNQQLLFLSNFNGSLDQYFIDFIDAGAWGLNGIFSNTQGYPRTLFMFLKGARNPLHFMGWARHYQVPTQVWYCAYPGLTIKNINNNTQLRNALSSKLNERQAEAFLRSIC